jgi:hypothetical protein
LSQAFWPNITQVILICKKFPDHLAIP